MGPHEHSKAVIDDIAESHRLTAHERQTLARIVAGAIPGNRDRPLFILALKLFARDDADLLSMIMPAASGLHRMDAALLDFLITAALESAEAVSELMAAFETARLTADPARAFTPALSAVLHAYRVRVLPEAQHHNVFIAVRRFLTGFRPEDPWPRDGDAPRFWVAEGQRDFLTRYVTALHALADYADAAKLTASWRETVTLEAAESIAASALEENILTAEDSLSRERLATSLALLMEAPIKLLHAHEREALEELGEHAALVLRCPGDVQAAMTLGPVQSAITQALRRTGEPVDIFALIKNGPSRQQVVDRIDDLYASLSACLHLIHQSITRADETASVGSSIQAAYTRRIAAMKRRQGFAQLPANNRNETLTGLIEPLLLFAQVLERYKRAWERLGPERGMALERAHRELFKEKFTVMYGAGQKE